MVRALKKLFSAIFLTDWDCISDLTVQKGKVTDLLVTILCKEKIIHIFSFLGWRTPEV
jgi:hypothetical protein